MSLLNNIKQVLIDLKSDRATVRTKCIDEFHNVLDNRARELRDVIRVNNNRREDNEHDLTWSDIFYGLNDAVKEQCGRNGNSRSNQKNDAYKEALRKLINVANEHVPNVSYTQICEAAFECFEDATFCYHFGAVYLQIVLKHILNAKHSLSEIDTAGWARLLQAVLQLQQGNQQNQITPLDLLQCIPLIVRHGTKYNYLASELHQHLPQVVQIITSQHFQNQINAQKQILLITYEFVRNLALNHRKATVEFTEQILEKLLSLYQPSMDAEAKLVLMKIMHISIIVHHPECEENATSSTSSTSDAIDGLFQKNMTNDSRLWKKLLRSMIGLVEREILDIRKRSIRLKQAPVICHTFMRMAAKLCSLVYWDGNIWSSNSEEQQPKKRRQTMKLERMLELVEYEPQKYCWAWFNILSQLCVDYPYLLQAEDYQSLLKLLTDFKPTIQYASHMKYFIRLAQVMLSKEKELKKSSSEIMESFCTEQWHKLMDISFKQAVIDKIQAENFDLMRVLIENHVIVSHEFIRTIVSDVTKMSSIKKSNHSIRLLISVLRNVNTDMIEDNEKLKIEVIRWLSSNLKLTELKRVIENTNTLDKQLVAQLYVLCALSRQTSTIDINSNSLLYDLADEPDALEHTLYISELIQNLQYLMLSKFIVRDSEFSKSQQPRAIHDLPARSELKMFLNEAIFKEIELAIHDVVTENVIESFNNIASSLETSTNILNCLVDHEAIDADHFRKYLQKSIFLKISQLNFTVSNFPNSLNVDDNLNEANEVVELLLTIYHDKYHPIIVTNIFIPQNNASVINWLLKQVRPPRRDESLVMMPLKSAAQMEFQERFQLKCLTLLAYFSAHVHPDQGDPEVFTAIQEYPFRHNRNQDLFIVFQLIKIIFNEITPSEQSTDWAFDQLKNICTKLPSNSDYMELVVNHIPALIRSVHPYPDLHDDLINLLSPLLKKIKVKKSKKYGPRISIKIIQSIQHFAKDFFNDEDCSTVIAFLAHFLQSDFLPIQMATVSSLANIFDKRFLSYDEAKVSCLVVQNFHLDLETQLKINGLEIREGDSVDRKTCIISTRLQLYCAIIILCYSLREQTWFHLIEFCSQVLQMSEEKTYEIISKLCMDVFQTQPSILLADLFPRLISLWIDKDYHLSHFPAMLTQCPSRNDFMVKYLDTITLRIIIHKTSCIRDLLIMTTSSSLSEILNNGILVKCLANLTSSNQSESETKKDKAKETWQILRAEQPDIDSYFKSHALEIAEELLTNMWDDAKFHELFEADVEFVKDERTIDLKTFKKSLLFIQQKAKKSTNIIHHFCETLPRKVINMLYSFKLLFQQAACEELKLAHLLRLCVLTDSIVDYLTKTNPRNTNIVAFFIRDFVYFFGNIISADCSDKLKLATCKYFKRFCKTILPDCADQFKPHFNYVVSILMSVTKMQTPTQIVNVCMDLLHFLISDQKDVLKEAIGQLDSFPSQEAFSELRRIQGDMKYGGQSFSLLNEIEYFLAVDKRKAEGLLSLKEHLSTKKNELQEIYKTIYESRGFSEDCDKSPIHRLISSLLSQIVQNVDSEKSLIAAKCLAELGPSDLGSIALKFDVQIETYKICRSFEDAVSNLCKHALEIINSILTHRDTTVLQAAADACLQLFESKKAASYLEKFPLLRAFETQIKTDLPLKNTSEQLDLAKWFNDESFRSSHSFWVKSLAIELFTLFDNAALAQVSAKQTQFASAMVPLLVKVLLTTDNANHRQALNTATNLFFSNAFAKLGADQMEIENNDPAPVYLNKVSIKMMLNIVECIRMHNQNCKKELTLNYLHIAKAALYCKANFTAILYSELAISDQGVSQSDEIKSIMKSAYQSIGEMNAVSAFIDPIKQRNEYLELNGCWNEILIGMDVKSIESSEYTRYLSQAGLFGLANKLTQGKNSTNYECAWRLGDWNIIDTDASAGSENDEHFVEFDKYHYFALKCLRQRDQIGTKINVKKAYEAVIKIFKQSSYECTKNIYKNLMMLNLLQQIEDFSHIQFKKSADEESVKADFVMDKWKYQDQIASCGFNYREPILAQRTTMLESAGVVAKRKIEKLNDCMQQMILNLVVECREEGAINLGERYLNTVQKMVLSSEMQARVHLENAKLNWSRGNWEMAQHLLSTVVKMQVPSLTHAQALGMLGEYLAEARLEDTSTVIQTYLIKSTNFSTKFKKNAGAIAPESPYYQSPQQIERVELANRKRNYLAMAKFSDREYQQIAAYKKSTEFEKKMANIQRNIAIKDDMKNRYQSLTGDEKKSYTTLQNGVTIDESDVQTTNNEYNQHLHSAVEYYISALKLESDHEANISSTMFRLFGLWFTNTSDVEVLKEIEENYESIPTFKFIALMPQIVTHLCTDQIKHVIQDIVVKCAKDHPYHVLPKVLALVNAFKDDEYIANVNGKSAISSSPRTDAAIRLMGKLKCDQKLRKILEQMEIMCEVLIKLANTTLDPPTLPADSPLRKLHNLNLVHCPTVNLPVSTSANYTTAIVSIVRWRSSFSLTNGINRPKRIECIGSNGRQYSQLLKGTDDLRQDAVMQQVFCIMNEILTHSNITKKDRLHVRTYNIMPLSQRSGILEWCDNTMPLTDYLVGSSSRKGAHVRFRPGDWPPKKCRETMLPISIRTQPFDKVHKNYMDICEHIQPVFHNFFLEHFHNPGVWYERRMAYAHSLATTSMIGYILGIGDRHISNILIDKTTAELIHIDFGIAFEQGKCLPTAELIPFRLTRDLVSALGPSGVEGVYRKLCEKTMEVLRQNKSTILTIVDVLLHDPLYAWALTSKQASKRQDTSAQINEDNDINTMAERALNRLEEKLNGKHIGRSEAVSVKRHVEILIKEATNSKLLCRLFCGWQPYL